MHSTSHDGIAPDGVLSDRASGVAVTSIVSTFVGLLFVVLLGAEYNIAGLIGLISLAFVSVISGIVYLTKLKEECYRGRTLKKANAEAAKKALLPTVDLHVVLVAIGVACYLLGGVVMKSFAVVTILGGIASLLLNLLGLRGLEWLVTNEQALAGRYDLFDVAADQVADGLDESKPKYEGANADKDFTKRKKPVAIAAIALLVASVATLVVFGVKDKGAVYNTTSPYANSQVYVEYKSETANNTALTAEVKDKVDDILNNAYLGEQQFKAIVEVETFDYVTKIDSTKSGNVTAYYAYYRLTFDRALTGEEEMKYDNTKMTVAKFFSDEGLSDAGITLPNNVEMSLKDSVRVSADQPAFGPIALATGVGIAIAAFYLLLRYRLSRGLANLLVAVGATGIAAGLLSMLHFIQATSYASVAVPFVTVFTLAIAIILMNRERELVLENRSKDNSVENRNAIMIKATALASTPITVAFVIALYLGVNFFGFMMTPAAWIFLAIFLGAIISTVVVLVCFGPLAQVFYKLFSGVQIIKPRAKKKKARPVRVNKSAEPEEAIFIGIND